MVMCREYAEKGEITEKNAVGLKNRYCFESMKKELKKLNNHFKLLVSDKKLS